MYVVLSGVTVVLHWKINTSDVSCRDTRSTNCNQLYTPKLNCELFRKSFMYSGSAIWNSLPYMLKMQLRLTLLNPYV